MIENTNETKENKCPISVMYDEYEHFHEDTMSRLQLMSSIVIVVFCLGIIAFSMYSLTRY